MRRHKTYGKAQGTNLALLAKKHFAKRDELQEKLTEMVAEYDKVMTEELKEAGVTLRDIHFMFKNLNVTMLDSLLDAQPVLSGLFSTRAAWSQNIARLLNRLGMTMESELFNKIGIGAESIERMLLQYAQVRTSLTEHKLEAKVVQVSYAKMKTLQEQLMKALKSMDECNNKLNAIAERNLSDAQKEQVREAAKQGKQIAALKVVDGGKGNGNGNMKDRAKGKMDGSWN